MTMKIREFSCLVNIIVILFTLTGIFNVTYAKEPNSFINWNIGTSKQTFYPGEPVLLTLNITNSGSQEEKVDFGTGGIGAFSIEVYDSNGTVVAKKGQIQRHGFTTKMPFVVVSPNNICQKSIVLNQWCSTLLPSGKYHILCDVEYRLRSEDQNQPNTVVLKAGPLHKIPLNLDISIKEQDKAEFKKILDALIGFEVKPDTQNKMEWFANREQAREMLAFAESELAVPYQLKILRVEQGTRLKQDIINSLVRSGSSEAAEGLVKIIEDPKVNKEDIINDSIDAVYRLRDSGKPGIISATSDFVAKHERPVLAKPMD